MVTVYAEKHREIVKLLKALDHKPIVTFVTQERLPEVPEIDQMAKIYATKNASKGLAYPDGLDDLFPKLLTES